MFGWVRRSWTPIAISDHVEGAKSSVDVRKAKVCRRDDAKGRTCLRLIEGFQSFSSSRMLKQMVPEG